MNDQLFNSESSEETVGSLKQITYLLT